MVNRVLCFVFIVEFLLTFMGAAPSQAGENVLTLSLKQCIDLALKNNIDVLLSHSREKQAEGEQTVLTAELLPQIDAVASQQRTWWENIGGLGFPGFTGVIGPFNTFNAGIMVSQRILDLSVLAHAEAGKLKWKAAQLEMDLSNQQVILATGLAYLQALGFAEELSSSAQDVQLAEHFLTLSRHQLDAGLASSLDVARERTQLAQQLARQEQLRLDVVKSQLALKRLIKVPLSQTIELTNLLDDQRHRSLNVEDALTMAYQSRMDIRVAKANNDYSFEELKASRREYWPKVNITGQWGAMGLTPDNSTHAANAMLSVSLPLWEGGRIAGDIKEQEGINEEQRSKTEDLNWQIEEDVRISLETLVSTRTQLEAEAQVVNFAQEEMNLAQDRFTNGLGDNIQLINAQDALADARDKYVQSEAQYDQAQLNYFAALGDPQSFDLKGTRK